MRDFPSGLVEPSSSPRPSIACSCNSCCTDLCESCYMALDVQSSSDFVVQATDSQIQETVQFLDEELGDVSGMRSVLPSSTYADQAVIDASLGDFLSRPVKIANFQWLETDSVGATLNTVLPWYAFFNDTRIKYKLNNYAFISCNLRLKVMVNASPFYYGSLLGNYIPDIGLTASTITDTSTTDWLCAASQRPHGWVSPQTNSGFEMTLPFFWHKNWLRVNHYQDFKDMGSFAFVVYNALTSANAAVGTGVTVQVFAWAEDVKISGPTLGLALAIQADDEYNKGAVSGIASQVAIVASKFKKIPVIGAFARATEIGARMLAMGASLFGYSNPPVINDTQPFRSQPFPNLSTSEISYPIERLSLDPKAELTIDSRVVGLDGTDEMEISRLAQHDSFLTFATWSTGGNVDDILFASDVTPCLFRASALASGESIHMTPMCWVAQLFRHWRGDIIFRFRFICSQYHKGRVIIHYDPSGYAVNNVGEDPVASTVTYTRIVDLSEETDVEFKVPYMQALPWLTTIVPKVSNIFWASNPGSSGRYTQEGITNGDIVVRVQNALTAPVASSSIFMQVFVRGSDNLEFANPGLIFGTQFQPYSLFPTQSRNELPSDVERLKDVQTNNTSDHRYLVNFGERIQSLRQLMRRTVMDSYFAPDLVTGFVASQSILVQMYRSKWPRAYGYDPNGFGAARGIVSGTQKPFNWSIGNWYHYIATPFIATRGAMNWSVNVTGKPVGHIRAYRSPNYDPGDADAVLLSQLVPAGTGEAYSNSLAYSTSNLMICGSSGSSLINQQSQAGLNYVHPNYSAFKMYSTDPMISDLVDTYTDSLNDIVVTEFIVDPSNALPTGTLSAQTYNNTALSHYYSIGTDYNLMFFLNVPTWYKYASVPVLA